MKKIIFLNILVILVLFLTGCWDSKELNKLGISLIMGVDMENDKVLLTVGFIKPISAQESNMEQDVSVKYVQGVGNNMLEAFRDITLKFDRRVFASHNKIVIFGEEFAKQGLIDHIDELFRDREQRETSYILVAKGSKAYDVMGINPGLEQMPANYILNLVRNTNSNPKAMDTNFIDYIKHHYHKGHHPVVGIIQKRKREIVDKSASASKASEYELSILGSAIFDKDSLVGYLNGNDTKALNFFMDNVKMGIVTFPTPIPLKNEGKSNSLSSVYIINNKTKNDVEILDGKIILKTKIKLRSSLGEVVGDIDISKEENIKKMEEACSKAIEEALKEALRKGQEVHKLDIFGFGLVFHRKYPKLWKEIENNWDEIFSEAEFQIEVDTNIIRTGLINTPINRVKVK
ncbi:Ger(x)C family spore germination protein [Tissierella sp. MB52-C2]|uniref:Ger(x)C family spore germination protein n=1 Tax=Tissierella sp. MB52-C2 TaxID=3070999 RepID=UPI00280BA228|nr:Ger(x)C family spore germination protein [Tissierella sp. MB52-C2]WMM23810.1 Ger(x)C family spore germination protein [Tissierella sp. MB52-C2]